MAPETLENILVQRHQLANNLVKDIRASALTNHKHYHLLVGMRGIGKTHMVSLIYHRISKIDELQDKLLIAWLREEEWGVTSFLDLLLRIFRALKEEYPAEYQAKLNDPVESLYQLSADEAESKGGELLREFVGDWTLLLLVENLDDLCTGLGKIGENKFRQYLKNYSFLTILATAQNSLDGISRKDYPFYGFFSNHQLEELTLDEAVELLGHIANLEEDRELESFIHTSTGRDRIKAVHHLAGGNPRVYVIFSQFLTRKSLDELVAPFMRMLDDLTPYYQSRMSWLSQQQRKIIEFLADCRQAVTVKEIAQRCFITQQTASSQLKDLRDKGYVNSEGIGRESFYELREPLMRFCLEMKKQRGEPIRLFVDFLRIWYTRRELEEGLIPANGVLERDYIKYALQLMDEDEEDPRIKAYEREYFNYYWQQDYISALKHAEKLVEIQDDASAWGLQALALSHLNRNKELLANYDKLIEFHPNTPMNWTNKGIVLNNLNRKEEALACFDKTIEIDPNFASAWHNRGIVLNNLNRKEEALACFDKTIEIDPNFASAWHNRGIVLDNLNRKEEALASYDKAIEIDPNYAIAWQNRGFILNNLNRKEEALACYIKANASSWYNRGMMLNKLNRKEEALACFDKAIEIYPNYAIAWHNRAIVVFSLNRQEESLALFDKVIEIDPNYTDAWNNKGWVLSTLGRYEEALASCDKAIQLGDESSNVFFNRAIAILGLNWDQGIVVLADAFSRIQPDNQPSEEDAKLIINILFNDTQNRETWHTRLSTLIALYHKHQTIPISGKGAVQNIPTLMSEMVSDKAVQTWLEVWQELTNNYPECQIPIRLLKAAVDYKVTKGDKRILLELPIEERNLLKQVLEIE